jgi:UDP-N-acetylmuramoylalanine--D-glutamate ligase
MSCDSALVLGCGESGSAAAELLLRENRNVTIIDGGSEPALSERASRLASMGARVMTGATDLPDGEFDLCVVSPGIRSDNAWLKKARGRTGKVISELELGWSRCRSRTLAVTGSNGKSTVVKFCRDALRAAGDDAVMCGNCGPAISRICLEDRDPQWLVIEVSSFQLETVVDFRPDIGVLLNILPNHLDRHGGMADYTRIKMRLFGAMDRGNIGLLPADPAELRGMAGSQGIEWLTFGRGKGADYVFNDGEVSWDGEGGKVSLRNTVFDNAVLGVNAAAAIGALCAAGVQPATIASAASSFEPLEHRMSDIGMVGGVRFIDDSKATNIAALCAAVRTASGQVRLIAGGMLKEKDATSAKEVLATKALKVYLIGRDAEALKRQWDGSVPCKICVDLRNATESAWREGGQGETVLLSPGCASFDQFRNFEDRGVSFRNIVNSLRRNQQ